MTGYESKKAMAQDKITDEQGRPMTYWGGKAQPAQEPVAWMNDMGTHIDLNVSGRGIPLYTTPPQRKPLTQDGTMEIANQTAGQYWMDEAHIQRFRAAVEAAHGIKENT